jgi:hypothetical protein
MSATDHKEVQSIIKVAMDCKEVQAYRPITTVEQESST